ncbi:NAD-dependent succinate-semialdehyde dehydrogenase [Variovorax paradoxus]|uniref:NAD-dependent succinate-semialdehyde dehydrogenase n=1 Tax=Variovorax paradoxus TaxID=34073 RepID=UPI003AAFB92F
MTIESINPATGEKLEAHAEMPRAAVDDIIGKTHEAFLAWRGTSFEQRAQHLREAAKILRAKSDTWGRLMAREMGKPLRDGIAEAQKCAACCEFFADNAARLLAREPADTEARTSFVTFNPLGVVLAVMPWNFPFWQVFRFAAPALMAGNAAVLKHASNVPGCALAIEQILREAGVPEHLFRTLLIGNAQVDAAIGHPLVRALTLTGSGPAGSAVARKAGEMLKKTVLELGGSDPYLVLEDADLDLAASVCTKGRLVNGGQSCIAAKRFIVVEPVRREFEQRFVQKMKAVRQGDPLDMATEIGPLALHALRDLPVQRVAQVVPGGARCLLGGQVPEGPGAYYPPTVLTDVAKGMPAYDEELFGPVAAVIPVRGEEEAIAVANDSSFGLGAAVITRDLARAERIAAESIEAGCVFVNEAVRSDPRLPFGGVKDSGYGRELSGYGIKEFVNIKTVWVAQAGHQ